MTKPKRIASAVDLDSEIAAKIDDMFPLVRGRKVKIALMVQRMEEQDKEIRELKELLTKCISMRK